MTAPGLSEERVVVDPVRIEHHREPMGIGEVTPRLSWVNRTSINGWRQCAYELEATDPAYQADPPGPRTTGRVDSRESVLIAWPWAPLSSCAQRSVRVRVWGEADGEPSDWSSPTELETGLLTADEWSAQLISPELPSAGANGEPVALLRGELELGVDPVRARLRITGHGLLQVHLNGSVVGDEVLTPGWTSYNTRLRYRTYDVTHLLRSGGNAIGVELADGWFRGFLGFAGRRNVYGDTTGALVQLEVDCVDGSRVVAGTDGTWRSTLGPITRADLYMGETYDARRRIDGWTQPGFDDGSWSPVTVGELDPTTLVAPTGPPVRRTQTLQVNQVLASPSGRTILDFGQNLVGHLRVSAPAAPAGTKLTFKHAEVLENGELSTRPLRKATQTDEVILDGSPLVWEPSFTVHGFRYVEVGGWPTAVSAGAFEAVVVHTDLRRTGHFRCSDQLLDRLHENVIWGMRGNFVDVPTDCPQRDERMGWTGDLQVFAPTASFLYDTAGMLASWLADLRADQRPDGVSRLWVPWFDVGFNFPDLGPEAGWGDAATFVPWALYMRYGDPEFLGRQWSSMTAWVDAFAMRAGEHLDFPAGGFSLGDWLDPSAPPDKPAQARTPWQLVSTAYLARSAQIVADAAVLLGDADAERRYGALATRARERFVDEYVTPNGRLAYPAPTAYALALAFDLLPVQLRQRAGDLLASQVAADGFRIGTGFLGTPLVCDALAETDNHGTAWELLLQTECPSWLYPVTIGATTIWERWDSMLPDGSINPGEMTSLNHYALGAVGDFLHRRVAGLAPAEPGYRRLRIAPLPTRALDWARAELETPYGTAFAGWEREEDELVVTIRIPASCEADVLLPDGSPVQVAGPGDHSFRCVLPEARVAERPPAFGPPE